LLCACAEAEITCTDDLHGGAVVAQWSLSRRLYERLDVLVLDLALARGQIYVAMADVALDVAAADPGHGRFHDHAAVLLGLFNGFLDRFENRILIRDHPARPSPRGRQTRANEAQARVLLERHGAARPVASQIETD
jgi:hypothetical protein